MYKALITWRDLEDHHLYHSGDTFPHDGREVSPERLAQLASSNNRVACPVIEEVTDNKETTENGSNLPSKTPEDNKSNISLSKQRKASRSKNKAEKGD